MNMTDNEYEAILEACVEEIAEGESSLEECLARYPQYAAEMEPILLTATQLKSGRELKPSPFLRGRIRAELNHAAKNSPQPKMKLPLYFWRMALNVAVLVFALLMTNTVFAQGALPGDSLYNWKLSSERVWRMVSADPLGTDLQLSNRRINEYVAVGNDETRRTRVLASYNELLTRFRSEGNDSDQQRILVVLQSQRDSLHQAGLSIPALEDYVSGASRPTP
jgi:hypothetical protein